MSARMVQVDLSPQNVTVVGEQVAPGLAITPVVTPDGGLNGMWTLTHVPTGLSFIDVRQPLPITHLRFMARLMAEYPGVDWCTPIPTAKALAVARRAERSVAAMTVDALLQAMDEREGVAA